MPNTVLTGLEKSAILLMCLGEDATAQVFNELSDSQVQKITSAMVGINHIPHHVREYVLDQYHEAQKQCNGIFFKGSEFARNSIHATTSGKRKETLLELHASKTEMQPFVSLSTMVPQIAATVLENEHPQLAALIISTQHSDHGAAIIEHLPESMQADVIKRIAKLETVSEDVIENLEHVFNEEIGCNAPLECKTIKGFNQAVELLSKMGSNQHTGILETVGEDDDELADKMRREMFSFESLRELDDLSLQTVLREIHNETLAVALQNCSAELRRRIFANMSSRAVAMIREDLDSPGNIRASDVKSAQQTIVRTAMGLKENGAFLAARQTL